MMDSYWYESANAERKAISRKPVRRISTFKPGPDQYAQVQELKPNYFRNHLEPTNRHVSSNTGSMRDKFLKISCSAPTSEKARIIAYCIKRHIIQTKEQVKRTPNFVKKTHAKIVYLHNYNSRVAQVCSTYPLDNDLTELLVKYIELELSILKNPEYDTNIYRVTLERRLLTLLFGIYSKYCFCTKGRFSRSDTWHFILGLFEVVPYDVHKFFEYIRQKVKRKIDFEPDPVHTITVQSQLTCYKELDGTVKVEIDLQNDPLLRCCEAFNIAPEVHELPPVRIVHSPVNRPRLECGEVIISDDELTDTGQVNDGDVKRELDAFIPHLTDRLKLLKRRALQEDKKPELIIDLCDEKQQKPEKGHDRKAKSILRRNTVIDLLDSDSDEDGCVVGTSAGSRKCDKSVVSLIDARRRNENVISSLISTVPERSSDGTRDGRDSSGGRTQDEADILKQIRQLKLLSGSAEVIVRMVNNKLVITPKDNLNTSDVNNVTGNTALSSDRLLEIQSPPVECKLVNKDLQPTIADLRLPGQQIVEKLEETTSVKNKASNSEGKHTFHLKSNSPVAFEPVNKDTQTQVVDLCRKALSHQQQFVKEPEETNSTAASVTVNADTRPGVVDICTEPSSHQQEPEGTNSTTPTESVNADTLPGIVDFCTEPLSHQQQLLNEPEETNSTTASQSVNANTRPGVVDICTELLSHQQQLVEEPEGTNSATASESVNADTRPGVVGVVDISTEPLSDQQQLVKEPEETNSTTASESVNVDTQPGLVDIYTEPLSHQQQLLNEPEETNSTTASQSVNANTRPGVVDICTELLSHQQQLVEEPEGTNSATASESVNADTRPGVVGVVDISTEPLSDQQQLVKEPEETNSTTASESVNVDTQPGLVDIYTEPLLHQQQLVKESEETNSTTASQSVNANTRPGVVDICTELLSHQQQLVEEPEGTNSATASESVNADTRPGVVGVVDISTEPLSDQQQLVKEPEETNSTTASESVNVDTQPRLVDIYTEPLLHQQQLVKESEETNSTTASESVNVDTQPRLVDIYTEPLLHQQQLVKESEETNSSTASQSVNANTRPGVVDICTELLSHQQQLIEEPEGTNSATASESVNADTRPGVVGVVDISTEPLSDQQQLVKEPEETNSTTASESVNVDTQPRLVDIYTEPLLHQQQLVKESEETNSTTASESVNANTRPGVVDISTELLSHQQQLVKEPEETNSTTTFPPVNADTQPRVVDIYTEPLSHRQQIAEELGTKNTDNKVIDFKKTNEEKRESNCGSNTHNWQTEINSVLSWQSSDSFKSMYETELEQETRAAGSNFNVDGQDSAFVSKECTSLKENTARIVTNQPYQGNTEEICYPVVIEQTDQITINFAVGTLKTADEVFRDVTLKSLAHARRNRIALGRENYDMVDESFLLEDDDVEGVIHNIDEERLLREENDSKSTDTEEDSVHSTRSCEESVSNVQHNAKSADTQNNDDIVTKDLEVMLESTETKVLISENFDGIDNTSANTETSEKTLETDTIGCLDKKLEISLNDPQEVSAFTTKIDQSDMPSKNIPDNIDSEAEKPQRIEEALGNSELVPHNDEFLSEPREVQPKEIETVKVLNNEDTMFIATDVLVKESRKDQNEDTDLCKKVAQIADSVREEKTASSQNFEVVAQNKNEEISSDITQMEETTRNKTEMLNYATLPVSSEVQAIEIMEKNFDIPSDIMGVQTVQELSKSKQLIDGTEQFAENVLSQVFLVETQESSDKPAVSSGEAAEKSLAGKPTGTNVKDVQSEDEINKEEMSLGEDVNVTVNDKHVTGEPEKEQVRLSDTLKPKNDEQTLEEEEERAIAEATDSFRNIKDDEIVLYVPGPAKFTTEQLQILRIAETKLRGDPRQFLNAAKNASSQDEAHELTVDATDLRNVKGLPHSSQSLVKPREAIDLRNVKELPQAGQSLGTELQTEIEQRRTIVENEVAGGPLLIAAIVGSEKLPVDKTTKILTEFRDPNMLEFDAIINKTADVGKLVVGLEEPNNVTENNEDNACRAEKLKSHNGGKTTDLRKNSDDLNIAHATEQQVDVIAYEDGPVYMEEYLVDNTVEISTEYYGECSSKDDSTDITVAVDGETISSSTENQIDSEVLGEPTENTWSLKDFTSLNSYKPSEHVVSSECSSLKEVHTRTQAADEISVKETVATKGSLIEDVEISKQDSVCASENSGSDTLNPQDGTSSSKGEAPLENQSVCLETEPMADEEQRADAEAVSSFRNIKHDEIVLYVPEPGKYTAAQLRILRNEETRKRDDPLQFLNVVKNTTSGSADDALNLTSAKSKQDDGSKTKHQTCGQSSVLDLTSARNDKDDGKSCDVAIVNDLQALNLAPNDNIDERESGAGSHDQNTSVSTKQKGDSQESDAVRDKQQEDYGSNSQQNNKDVNRMALKPSDIPSAEKIASYLPKNGKKIGSSSVLLFNPEDPLQDLRQSLSKYGTVVIPKTNNQDLHLLAETALKHESINSDITDAGSDSEGLLLIDETCISPEYPEMQSEVPPTESYLAPNNFVLQIQNSFQSLVGKGSSSITLYKGDNGETLASHRKILPKAVVREYVRDYAPLNSRRPNILKRKSKKVRPAAEQRKFIVLTEKPRLKTKAEKKQMPLLEPSRVCDSEDDIPLARRVKSETPSPKKAKNKVKSRMGHGEQKPLGGESLGKRARRKSSEVHKEPEKSASEQRKPNENAVAKQSLEDAYSKLFVPLEESESEKYNDSDGRETYRSRLRPRSHSGSEFVVDNSLVPTVDQVPQIIEPIGLCVEVKSTDLNGKEPLKRSPASGRPRSTATVDNEIIVVDNSPAPNKGVIAPKPDDIFIFTDVAPYVSKLRRKSGPEQNIEPLTSDLESIATGGDSKTSKKLTESPRAKKSAKSSNDSFDQEVVPIIKVSGGRGRGRGRGRGGRGRVNEKLPSLSKKLKKDMANMNFIPITRPINNLLGADRVSGNKPSYEPLTSPRKTLNPEVKGSIRSTTLVPSVPASVETLTSPRRSAKKPNIKVALNQTLKPSSSKPTVQSLTVSVPLSCELSSPRKPVKKPNLKLELNHTFKPSSAKPGVALTTPSSDGKESIESPPLAPSVPSATTPKERYKREFKAQIESGKTDIVTPQKLINKEEQEFNKDEISEPKVSKQKSRETKSQDKDVKNVVHPKLRRKSLFSSCKNTVERTTEKLIKLLQTDHGKLIDENDKGVVGKQNKGENISDLGNNLNKEETLNAKCVDNAMETRTNEEVTCSERDGSKPVESEEETTASNTIKIADRPNKESSPLMPENLDESLIQPVENQENLQGRLLVNSRSEDRPVKGDTTADNIELSKIAVVQENETVVRNTRLVAEVVGDKNPTDEIPGEKEDVIQPVECKLLNNSDKNIDASQEDTVLDDLPLSELKNITNSKMPKQNLEIKCISASTGTLTCQEGCESENKECLIQESSLQTSITAEHLKDEQKYITEVVRLHGEVSSGEGSVEKSFSDQSVDVELGVEVSATKDGQSGIFLDQENAIRQKELAVEVLSNIDDQCIPFSNKSTSLLEKQKIKTFTESLSSEPLKAQQKRTMQKSAATIDCHYATISVLAEECSLNKTSDSNDSDLVSIAQEAAKHACENFEEQGTYFDDSGSLLREGNISIGREVEVTDTFTGDKEKEHLEIQDKLLHLLHDNLGSKTFEMSEEQAKIENIDVSSEKSNLIKNKNSTKKEEVSIPPKIKVEEAATKSVKPLQENPTLDDDSDSEVEIKKMYLNKSKRKDREHKKTRYERSKPITETDGEKSSKEKHRDNDLKSDKYRYDRRSSRESCSEERDGRRSGIRGRSVSNSSINSTSSLPKYSVDRGEKRREDGGVYSRSTSSLSDRDKYRDRRNDNFERSRGRRDKIRGIADRTAEKKTDNSHKDAEKEGDNMKEKYKDNRDKTSRHSRVYTKRDGSKEDIQKREKVTKGGHNTQRTKSNEQKNLKTEAKLRKHNSSDRSWKDDKNEQGCSSTKDTIEDRKHSSKNKEEMYARKANCKEGLFILLDRDSILHNYCDSIGTTEKCADGTMAKASSSGHNFSDTDTQERDGGKKEAKKRRDTNVERSNDTSVKLPVEQKTPLGRSESSNAKQQTDNFNAKFHQKDSPTGGTLSNKNVPVVDVDTSSDKAKTEIRDTTEPEISSFSASTVKVFGNEEKGREDSDIRDLLHVLEANDIKNEEVEFLASSNQTWGTVVGKRKSIEDNDSIIETTPIQPKKKKKFERCTSPKPSTDPIMQCDTAIVDEQKITEPVSEVQECFKRIEELVSATERNRETRSRKEVKTYIEESLEGSDSDKDILGNKDKVVDSVSCKTSIDGGTAKVTSAVDNLENENKKIMESLSAGTSESNVFTILGTNENPNREEIFVEQTEQAKPTLPKGFIRSEQQVAETVQDASVIKEESDSESSLLCKRRVCNTPLPENSDPTKENGAAVKEVKIPKTEVKKEPVLLIPTRRHGRTRVVAPRKNQSPLSKAEHQPSEDRNLSRLPVTSEPFRPEEIFIEARVDGRQLPQLIFINDKAINVAKPQSEFRTGILPVEKVAKEKEEISGEADSREVTGQRQFQLTTDGELIPITVPQTPFVSNHGIAKRDENRPALQVAEPKTGFNGDTKSDVQRRNGLADLELKEELSLVTEVTDTLASKNSDRSPKLAGVQPKQDLKTSHQRINETFEQYLKLSELTPDMHNPMTVSQILSESVGSEEMERSTTELKQNTNESSKSLPNVNENEQIPHYYRNPSPPEPTNTDCTSNLDFRNPSPPLNVLPVLERLEESMDFDPYNVGADTQRPPMLPDFVENKDAVNTLFGEPPSMIQNSVGVTSSLSFTTSHYPTTIADTAVGYQQMYGNNFQNNLVASTVHGAYMSNLPTPVTFYNQHANVAIDDTQCVQSLPDFKHGRKDATASEIKNETESEFSRDKEHSNILSRDVKFLDEYPCASPEQVLPNFNRNETFKASPATSTMSQQSENASSVSQQSENIKDTADGGAAASNSFQGGDHNYIKIKDVLVGGTNADTNELNQNHIGEGAIVSTVYDMMDELTFRDSSSIDALWPFGVEPDNQNKIVPDENFKVLVESQPEGYSTYYDDFSCLPNSQAYDIDEFSQCSNSCDLEGEKIDLADFLNLSDTMGLDETPTHDNSQENKGGVSATVEDVETPKAEETLKNTSSTLKIKKEAPIFSHPSVPDGKKTEEVSREAKPQQLPQLVPLSGVTTRSASKRDAREIYVTPQSQSMHNLRVKPIGDLKNEGTNPADNNASPNKKLVLTTGVPGGFTVNALLVKSNVSQPTANTRTTHIANPQVRLGSSKASALPSNIFTRAAPQGPQPDALKHQHGTSNSPKMVHAWKQKQITISKHDLKGKRLQVVYPTFVKFVNTSAKNAVDGKTGAPPLAALQPDNSSKTVVNGPREVGQTTGVNTNNVNKDTSVAGGNIKKSASTKPEVKSINKKFSTIKSPEQTLLFESRTMTRKVKEALSQTLKRSGDANDTTAAKKPCVRSPLFSDPFDDLVKSPINRVFRNTECKSDVRENQNREGGPKETQPPGHQSGSSGGHPQNPKESFFPGSRSKTNSHQNNPKEVPGVRRNIAASPPRGSQSRSSTPQYTSKEGHERKPVPQPNLREPPSEHESTSGSYQDRPKEGHRSRSGIHQRLSQDQTASPGGRYTHAAHPEGSRMGSKLPGVNGREKTKSSSSHSVPDTKNRSDHYQTSDGLATSPNGSLLFPELIKRSPVDDPSGRNRKNQDESKRAESEDEPEQPSPDKEPDFTWLDAMRRNVDQGSLLLPSGNNSK